MNIPLARIAATICVAAVVGNAQAGLVTSSISFDEFVGNGADYAGAFALAPLLAANGLEGGTFNSATLSAYGFSDTQINQHVHTDRSERQTACTASHVIIGRDSYRCGSVFNRRTCYSYEYGYAQYKTFHVQDYFESRDTIADSMLLVSGSASASDTVGRSRSPAKTIYKGSYTRANGTYGYDTVHHYKSHTTDVLSGALYAELGLGASDLLNLSRTGQFDFVVRATAGNFRLQGLTMTIDVDPAEATNDAEVPEPASGLLMIGGLAGLAAAARRSQRASARS